jgi:DNA-binding MarR family transcriptional regulator
VAEDWTDRVLDRWAKLAPGLDRTASEVAERVGRIALQLARWEDQVFSRHGLSRGEVGVLAALAVAEPSGRLSPSQLGRGLMLSSAGITSRLDRLQRRGLIARLPDPTDRRGVLVELTEDGQRVGAAAVADGAAALDRALAGLEPEEVETLARLLRKLQARLPQGLPYGP